MEYTEGPGQHSGLGIFAVFAAESAFDGMRHDLLERRIGHQEAVDHAGMIGVGTSELQRSRRAVGFRITGIGGDIGRYLVGRTDHRIETLERVAAVEKRVCPGQVLQVDLRKVKSPPRRHRQPIGYIESVGRVDAGIGVGRVQIDRAEAGIRLVDKHTGAGHEQVLIDRSKFALRRENRGTMIDGGAHYDMVVVPEDLVGVGDLGGATEAVGGGLVIVQFAQEGAAQGVRRRRAIHRPKNRIAVADAEVGVAIAWRNVGAVAVNVLLPEAAVIEIALEGPGVREIMGQGRVDEGKLKLCALRPRIDARPILIEQLDRRCRDVAQDVTGAGEIDMEFGVVAAGADVHIHAVDMR